MRFGIGYAPDSWNAVLRKFERERQNLLAAGLLIERGEERGANGGAYDRFRDRIMFPIRDARSRVLAFGGRILDQGEPKYLNSPETPVFHKGKELYGLYEARQSRQALKRVLIVEGYMDVVRLNQAGITNALATLGTATTAEHLTRVFRLTAEVVFGFDGDRAGRQAAWRALENALPQAREGRQLRFLFLPEGHDPDSLVGAEGREAFEARIEAAQPLSEYMVEHLSAEVDLTHVDGRARLAELARPLLQKIPAGVYRELLLDRLAESVRMPAASLARHIFGEAEAPPPATRSGKHRAAGMSAGRGSLVRQAITVLLNFPEAAAQVSRDAQLNGGEQPGVGLLLELLRELRERPVLHKAAVIERWRERPDGPHLLKLAAAECLVADSKAAAQELQAAIDRLLQEAGPGRRTDELLAKARDSGLNADEKLELQRLTRARGGGATTGGKP
jgi:DNA primase